MQDKLTYDERMGLKNEKNAIENLLKSEVNQKHLHSRLSIKRLLERAGLVDFNPANYTNRLRISTITEKGNIHTFKPEDKVKISLIQNIIQNPDIHL